MLAILMLLLVAFGSAQKQAGKSISTSPIEAQSHSGNSHDQELDARGDAAMGFEHTRTAHHFLLKKNGGVIQVRTDDAADADSRASIRKHLQHIARAFSQGDFQIPMLVHNQEPPGTEVMKQAKASIAYLYVELPHGAEVVISSADPKAIAAIHEFLRFQIREHRTGDPLN
jgi:hypothetical protein